MLIWAGFTGTGRPHAQPHRYRPRAQLGNLSRNRRAPAAASKTRTRTAVQHEKAGRAPPGAGGPVAVNRSRHGERAKQGREPRRSVAVYLVVVATRNLIVMPVLVGNSKSDVPLGKRINRPKDAWMTSEAEQLGILDADVWQRVQARIGDRAGTLLKARPVHLLSGLLKCGCCGSGRVMAPRSVSCSPAHR